MSQLGHSPVVLRSSPQRNPKWRTTADDKALFNVPRTVVVTIGRRTRRGSSRVTCSQPSGDGSAFVEVWYPILFPEIDYYIMRCEIMLFLWLNCRSLFRRVAG